MATPCLQIWGNITLDLFFDSRCCLNSKRRCPYWRILFSEIGDSLSRPLAYVLLVETNPFPNLSLFYRTMLFEYPSVLSRFCFVSIDSQTLTALKSLFEEMSKMIP